MSTRTSVHASRTHLPPWTSVLAIVAHPDDESFGLGAVLDAFATGGARSSVLCFTHGEASTLHGVDGDLHEIRARELAVAGERLGVTRTVLLGYRDAGLADVPLARLVREVTSVAAQVRATGLLVFDPHGITRHPDHVAATAAGVAAGDHLGLPVLAWTLPATVATRLNDERGTTFVGSDAVDIVGDVDRHRQRAAVEAHASQALPSSVLWRRLELLADREYLRILR